MRNPLERARTRIPRPHVRGHRISFLISFALGASACLADPKEADDVLTHLEAHYGESIVMRARLRSGARCSVADENGAFRAYCRGECRYCRGPLVVDSTLNLKEAGLGDWPMILAGSWKNRDIRCRGPLRKVICYPFEPGRVYVIRGRLEAHRPPRLLVQDFWEED